MKIWNKIKWLLATIGSIIIGVFMGYFCWGGKSDAEIKLKAKKAKEKKRAELDKLSDSDVIDLLDNADDVRRAGRWDAGTGADATDGGPADTDSPAPSETLHFTRRSRSNLFRRR